VNRLSVTAKQAGLKRMGNSIIEMNTYCFKFQVYDAGNIHIVETYCAEASCREEARDICEKKLWEDHPGYDTYEREEILVDIY